jgi:hypothetical protein
LVVFAIVGFYGVVFGLIQASDDPESHKCRLSMIFSHDIEVARSIPIGVVVGAIGGLTIEVLRQMEIREKPVTLNFNDDEETEGLVSIKKSEGSKNYENFVLQSDSDDENIAHIS